MRNITPRFLRLLLMIAGAELLPLVAVGIFFSSSRPPRRPVIPSTCQVISRMTAPLSCRALHGL